MSEPRKPDPMQQIRVSLHKAVRELHQKARAQAEDAVSDATSGVVDPGSGGGVYGGALPYGTPAITHGTTAGAGSSDQPIRRDARIVTFDAFDPEDVDWGLTQAPGVVNFAARRDHKHRIDPAASGDLSGNFPSPTVIKLRGRSISATAPAVGDVYSWDGSSWVPGPASGAGKYRSFLWAPDGLGDWGFVSALDADGNRVPVTALFALE
jgi:hypothetical protein